METIEPDTSIQKEFQARCQDLLEEMLDLARIRNNWDIYLPRGAGDRAIAGDHEERHLLELLQNVRDAIFKGRLEGMPSPK